MIGELDPSGNRLLFYTPDQYSVPNTYGIRGQDVAYALALDGSGNIYLAGATTCPYFPVSTGSAQTTLAGGWDGFVMKFGPSGTGLYSTLLGGAGSDLIFGMAADAAGDVFVTGSTASTNFPITTGAFQSRNNGSTSGSGTAFVAKLSPTLTLVYSTYLGGSGSDVGYAIAVDPSGATYITGETTSTNFPALGAIQSSFGGGAGDLFLTKLNGNGQTLAYSTYLGGSGEDYGFGVAVDAGLTPMLRAPPPPPISRCWTRSSRPIRAPGTPLWRRWIPPEARCCSPATWAATAVPAAAATTGTRCRQAAPPGWW